MKSVFLATSLLLFASVGRGADRACTVVTSRGENISFSASTAHLNGEYATYEKGSIGKVDFYLRSGHGVIRLEAWEADKLIATSWSQVIYQPQDGGFLNLDVRSSSGQSFEAQCSNVLAATGN